MKTLLSASLLALLPMSAFASVVVEAPEPGTLGLLAAGVGVAAYVANRRRRK